MRWWALILAAALASAAPKPVKKPVVEVVELEARRTTEGTLDVDGRVRNCGGKRLESVVLIFQVLAPGDEVVTTQKGELEESVLEPGEQAEFHWRMQDPARGVRVRVKATDHTKLDLGVANAGPFTIE